MKKYIAIFILSLLFFTIVKTPAHTILQEYFPDTKISGKILNGSIYHQKIGNINWVFQPLSLLTGKLSANIYITKDNNRINSNISIDLFGDIIINNANGNATIKYLRQFDKRIPNIVAANIKINSVNLLITDTVNFIPKTLNSDLVVTNLNILGEKIGNYKVNANFTENNKIAIILNTKNSVFNTNIKLNLNKNIINIKGKITANSEVGKGLLKNFGISEKINLKFKI